MYGCGCIYSEKKTHSYSKAESRYPPTIPLAHAKVMVADIQLRNLQSGSLFCILLRVSSDYAQPITGQVTEVAYPVIGRAHPELTPSKRQKTDPGLMFDHLLSIYIQLKLWDVVTHPCPN